MRFAALYFIAALSLGACQQQSQNDGAPPADAAKDATSGMVTDHDKWLPDWMPVARTAGGGEVRFQRSSVKRSEDGSTAEILAEIRYPSEQQITLEDAEFKEVLSFQRERRLFKIKCNDRTSVLAERQLMSSGDTVSRSIPYPQADENYAPITVGDPTAALFVPACGDGQQ
jgi:hypothetical protein